MIFTMIFASAKVLFLSLFFHGLIKAINQYKPKQITCQSNLYARQQQIWFKRIR